MTLDPKKLEEWKGRVTRDVADGPRGDDWPADVVAALIAEVERLGRLVKMRDDTIAELRVNRRSLEHELGVETDVPTELERLRALLREVEWKSGRYREDSRCPVCFGLQPDPVCPNKSDGHKPDCRLAAELKE